MFSRGVDKLQNASSNLLKIKYKLCSDLEEVNKNYSSACDVYIRNSKLGVYENLDLFEKENIRNYLVKEKNPQLYVDLVISINYNLNDEDWMGDKTNQKKYKDILLFPIRLNLFQDGNNHNFDEILSELFDEARYFARCELKDIDYFYEVNSVR